MFTDWRLTTDYVKHLKATHYKTCLLVLKYFHFSPSTTKFLWESDDTPRIELVDHAAVAVAVGVAFDVILWYFIWLCWFDCARSSILPDVSDILQKYFALLACWSTCQNFNGCLMVLMQHLNADPEDGGCRGGRGTTQREHAWNLKVGCQRSQWRGEIFSKYRYYTGEEYQMFNSLSGIL